MVRLRKDFRLANLIVNRREGVGSNSCNQLRKKGLVPGVVYGNKLEVIPVSFSKDDLGSLVKNRESTMTLSLGEQEENVVLKDVQYDHLGETVLHVDFFRVAKG